MAADGLFQLLPTEYETPVATGGVDPFIADCRSGNHPEEICPNGSYPLSQCGTGSNPHPLCTNGCDPKSVVY